MSDLEMKSASLMLIETPSGPWTWHAGVAFIGCQGARDANPCDGVHTVHLSGEGGNASPD